MPKLTIEIKFANHPYSKCQNKIGKKYIRAVQFHTELYFSLSEDYHKSSSRASNKRHTYQQGHYLRIVNRLVIQLGNSLKNHKFVSDKINGTAVTLHRYSRPIETTICFHSSFIHLYHLNMSSKFGSV